MIRWKRPLLVALALSAPGVLAEPAVTIKQVDLRASPASDAAAVATLPAESDVDLVQRQGAWVQLNSGKDTGWAKLFDIRLAGANTAPLKGGGTAASSLNLFKGDRAPSVTTGVRGLDAEMLVKATPNPQEFSKLVSYAATKAQAQVFAAAGNLEPRNVDLLK